MPIGIRIKDESGNVLIDSSTWCGQILGSRSIPANHLAGSFTDANLSLGRPFVFCMPADNNQGATVDGNPSQTSASVSGTTVSYSAGPSAIQIVYGIY